LSSNGFLAALERQVLIGGVVGVVGGLAGVLMSVVIEYVGRWFAGVSGVDLVGGRVVGVSWFLPLLVALGGLVSGVLTFLFAPEAEGHGTDSVIDAYHWRGARIRARVPVVKLSASAAFIGLGGSAGKEGPIALVGAGFGSVIAERLGLSHAERRLLVLAGVAGGISAVFRAPLGSMLFALEVPYRRDVEVEAILPLGVASIVAYAVAEALLGDVKLIVLPGVSKPGIGGLVFYGLLGFLAGLVARLYVWVFYGVRRLFQRLPGPAFVRPAVGGLAAGFIGLVLPETLGQGYPFLEKAMAGGLAFTTIAACVVGKMLTNALSVGSGGSGGVFAPSLFIGGMLGAAFAHLVSSSPAPELLASFSVVGMASFFAAAGKVPFTSIIMVSEITGGYELIVPSVIAVTFSYFVSGSSSIYEKQVNTRADSPYFLREVGEKLLHQLRVGEVMSTSIVSVSPKDPLSKVVELAARTHHTGFPVVENGRVVGMVTQSDLFAHRYEDMARIPVRQVMSRRVIAVTPRESLAEALTKMMRYDVGRLPVVEDYRSMRLVGIITKKDIIQAYDRLRNRSETA